MYLINSLISSQEILDERIELRKLFLELEIVKIIEVRKT